MSSVVSRPRSVLQFCVLLGALHCSSASEGEGPSDIPEYGSPPAMTPGMTPVAPGAPTAPSDSTPSGTPDGTSGEGAPDPSFMGGTNGN
ncbi:MAG TPA: hypothetical protein VMG12_07640, partial [Polyangiaceae bacterium]|nr:hypothetical protein [Polyangiaceae bacterium]